MSYDLLEEIELLHRNVEENHELYEAVSIRLIILYDFILIVTVVNNIIYTARWYCCILIIGVGVSVGVSVGVVISFQGCASSSLILPHSSSPPRPAGLGL